MMVISDGGRDFNHLIVSERGLRGIAYPRRNRKQKIAFYSQLNIEYQLFAPRPNNCVEFNCIKTEFLRKIITGQRPQFLVACRRQIHILVRIGSQGFLDNWMHRKRRLTKAHMKNMMTLSFDAPDPFIDCQCGRKNKLLYTRADVERQFGMFHAILNPHRLHLERNIFSGVIYWVTAINPQMARIEIKKRSTKSSETIVRSGFAVDGILIVCPVSQNSQNTHC